MSRWNQLDGDRIASLYRGGMTQEQISQEFGGIARATVRRYLRLAGVNIKQGKFVKGHKGHSLSHGMARSAEYRVWRGMKSRCGNSKSPSYKNYGGRGIRVCDEWLNSFESFFAYVGARPSEDHEIDRYPNNDGNYEPGNVRWATQEDQSRNKRTNRWIQAGSVRMIVEDWSKKIGKAPGTITKRLIARPTEALSESRLRKFSRLPHGTFQRYKNKNGCRCELCRFAYSKEMKLRRKAAVC